MTSNINDICYDIGNEKYYQYESKLTGEKMGNGSYRLPWEAYLINEKFELSIS